MPVPLAPGDQVSLAWRLVVHVHVHWLPYQSQPQPLLLFGLTYLLWPLLSGPPLTAMAYVSWAHVPTTRGSGSGGLASMAVAQKSISGTGLGLHIVKEIVQGHGGTVTLESEVDQGTTFWLHLPKQPVLAPHSPLSEVEERVQP